MSEFALQVEEREPGAMVVGLVGELTVGHTDDLQGQLRRVLKEPPERVVLDASQLTFICSPGLGVLLEFRKALSERGAALRLAGASAPIADVFRRTRLAELFPMFQDADAALETQ